MAAVRIIEVKEEILADNIKQAATIREELRKKKTMLLNLMSSPGSGKTSLILQTIAGLKDSLHIGVIEADIESAVDAEKVAAQGIPAIQLRTGGFCHLDATMVEKGIDALAANNLDLLIIENVGNLVCPAEFDTGAHKNVMILSVPEGDDKPAKYPMIFARAAAVLINKIDILAATDFNIKKVKADISKLNKNTKIFLVSAKTGVGMKQWCDWLENLADNKRKKILKKTRPRQ
jgi:hydrogenase accessory protein HypB